MSSPQILVVEDEALVAKNIGMELNELGYGLCGVAACGEDAIKIAAETHPDLVLMDIVLKGDLDGVETTQRIREQMDVPVVYITAYADDHTLERAKKTDPFGYLLKPYEERELHTTIQIALHKHRVERMLRDMHDWLDSALRWMPDAVILTDAKAGIGFINPVAEILTGWSQAESFGQSWDRVLQLVHKDTREPMRDLGAQALRTGGAVVVGEEWRLVTKHGEQKPVEGVISTICDRGGTLTGWVFLFRDVSERMQTEEALRRCEDQLRRWERMESAGRVAAGMAHDFNHLLTAILGNIAIVLNNLPQDDRNRNFLDTAEKAALQAAEIIKRLLTFTLQRKRRMETVDLNSLVSEIGDFLCGLLEPRIDLQVSQSDDLWPVRGDRAQLKEVILNLCLNARDAMPGHGTLSLQTGNVNPSDDGRNLTLRNRREEFVRLRVSDTGAGIPPDVQGRIFEPFFTTKGPGGTGMGLAVVSAIVTSHGGWIDCHSEVGRGTRFEVYLPRCFPGSADPGRSHSRGELAGPVSLRDCRSTIATTN
jgi:PAS domain S-box-containing protein